MDICQRPCCIRYGVYSFIRETPMIDIAKEVMLAYPELTPSVFASNIVIQDDSDGSGPYIRYWGLADVPVPPHLAIYLKESS